MRKPFLLKPVGKDYIWGGSRLNDEFNYGLPVSPLAEAWVCSTHPDGPSATLDATLEQVLTDNPDWLGSHADAIANGEFPILIKFIDAKQNLSVQVHPDDDYARKGEGSLGKTEMWYVLDAKPEAELVYGFNQDVTEDQVRDAIEQGCIESILNHVPVKKNDVFFIGPGTVHAVGAGILLAEIQESSNVTYRLYDYDRIDKNGNKRTLHINKALEVANLKSSATPRQPMRSLKYKRGYASELLARCKYFNVERLLLNTEGRVLPSIRTGRNSFHTLVVYDGCGVIYGEDVMLPFFKGDCIFIPANSMELKLHGKAQILNVSC